MHCVIIMKTYNKQRSQSSGLTTSRINYLNFADYHKQKLIGLSVQTDQQPSLCFSQLSKLSPFFAANHGIIIERYQQNRVKGKVNKEEIKQKIKDRIKAQIETLMKKNMFKIKRVDTKPHSTRHQQSVSIVGSPALKKSVHNFDKTTNKIENIRTDQNRQDMRRQKTANSSIRKSIAFAEQANYIRKTRSSLDHPRPGTVFTNERINQKQQFRNYNQSNNCMPLHRRSMSTDIRAKGMIRRKISEFQFKKKRKVSNKIYYHPG